VQKGPDRVWSRRTFVGTVLRGAGAWTAVASVPFVASCAPEPRPGPGRYRFPHGIASVDPRPDSVVLWTRVVDTAWSDLPGEAAEESRPPVELTLQVSLTADFGRLVLERPIVAEAATGHAVRVRVLRLAPDTIHYYRFVAGGDAPPLVGRTRTAPDPSNDRPVRLAITGGGGVRPEGWQGLVREDEATRQEDRMDAVLTLGELLLPAGAGSGAGPVEAPDGAAQRRARHHASLSDPDVQRALARWPLILSDPLEFEGGGDALPARPDALNFGRQLEVVVPDALPDPGVNDLLAASRANWKVLVVAEASGPVLAELVAAGGRRVIALTPAALSPEGDVHAPAILSPGPDGEGPSAAGVGFAVQGIALALFRRDRMEWVVESAAADGSPTVPGSSRSRYTVRGGLPVSAGSSEFTPIQVEGPLHEGG